MSIDRSTNNVTAIETDMRDVLRERNARSPNVTRQTDNDYSGLVSGISARSVHEIDHLIEGLQRLREKLNSDGAQLHSAITRHAAFNQSIIDLTKIVSDAMTSVSKSGGIERSQSAQEKTPDQSDRKFEEMSTWLGQRMQTPAP